MTASMVLCIILINYLVSSSAREQWIDPHDMAPKLPTSNRQKPTNQNLLTNKIQTEIDQCNCINTADDTVFIHYKRTLNILLNVLQSDLEDNQYKGVVTINLPNEDYNFLKRFVESPAKDVTQLKKVNSILDNMFSRTVFQKTSDNFASWIHWFYFTFYNHTTGIAIVAAFVSWIAFKLLRSNWTAWRVVKTLVLFAWVTDFAFTWIHLIQEEEIDKVADSLKYSRIPAACDPNRMNWWQYAWNIFSSNNECRQYHATMLQNVFWKVSPFTVFAHQFGIVIATPANNIGKAIGTLVSGMLKPLPFGINYILLPVLLLFFMIATCILLSFITNTSFQINLLHLISLKIGDKQRHMIGNLLSIPVEIQQEAIESVRNYERPKPKRIKEKKHCSEEQACIENVVRVEDVSRESDAELNEEDTHKDKVPDKNDPSSVVTDVATVMESGSDNEIRQRVCKTEKSVEDDCGKKTHD